MTEPTQRDCEPACPSAAASVSMTDFNEKAWARQVRQAKTGKELLALVQAIPDGYMAPDSVAAQMGDDPVELSLFEGRPVSKVPLFRGQS